MKTRGVAMRAFCIVIISQGKNGFAARGHFHDFGRFFVKQMIFTKMTQKCRGVVGGHPRPMRTRI